MGRLNDIDATRKIGKANVSGHGKTVDGQDRGKKEYSGDKEAYAPPGPGENVKWADTKTLTGKCLREAKDYASRK